MREGYSHGTRIEIDGLTEKHWFELSVARKAAIHHKDNPSLLVVSQDITHRVQNEILMHRLMQALEQNPNPIIITDLDARVVYVNHAFVNNSGYSSEEVIGKKANFLRSGKTPASTYHDLWRTLLLRQPWKGEFINRRKNGSEYLEQALIYPIKDQEGRCTHYLAYKEDITDRRAASERIHQLSSFDQLTGLPNQRLLNERFLLVQGVDSKQVMTVLWLNLDNFKSINDAIGYSAGDIVLREVTQRLHDLIRDQDMVSRLSSDNFVMLLPGRDRDNAALIATEVLAKLSIPLHLQQNELVLSASVGLAFYPNDGETLESLLHRAETAMYWVKTEGRNSYRFFAPDMQSRSARFLQLSSALRQAIARDELRLVYQPQISLETGRLVGAEALLRWKHPKLGNISPAEFIPVAENTGLIVQLGDWVINCALQQLRRWLDDDIPVVKIAVNLSAVQFAQPDLVDNVTQWVAEKKVPPALLELELTEAVAMQRSAAEIMRRLSEQGFHLSIDDFGTGYSSLSSLKGFAVNKLKIDQSFIRELEHDTDDQAIIRTVIQMARSLGLSSIAEGVETAAQLTFLRENGCNEVQGYFFSKPLEVADFTAFMEKQQFLL